MEIKEQDFYDEADMAHGLPINIDPRAQDLSKPAVPLNHRLLELEEQLSGAPMDKVKLICKKRPVEADERILVFEYDVHRERWTDQGQRV